MKKPLKDLIAEADRYLGQTKVAANATTDEVSSLADTLAFATQLEESLLSSTVNTEFEKVAKALNKISAAAEIEVILNTKQFSEAAIKSGYTEEQISEALDKVAAQKIHKNLGTLVAMGALAPSKEDLNSLHHLKKVVAVGEDKRVLPVVRALRGAV